jgi:hypothetical protein
MTISDVCEFKLNFQDADFWLIRKGSEKTVGTPVKEFSSEYIGVKVINTDLVLPDFLFYYFQFLHMQGLFTQYAHGTLNLKNIKISDIKNIPIAFK